MRMTTATQNQTVVEFNTFEELFKIVPASRLTLDADSLRGYRPRGHRQKEFKKLLEQAINSGVKDFRKPVIDPSIEFEKIIFSDSKKPCFTHSPRWWDTAAQSFLPEKRSRLQSPKEYLAFCGILLETLIQSMTVPEAWRAICDDSIPLGEFWYTMEVAHDFSHFDELGWADLVINQKILKDEESGHFYKGVTQVDQFAGDCSIAEVEPISQWEADFVFSGSCMVGSIVTDV